LSSCQDVLELFWMSSSVSIGPFLIHLYGLIVTLAVFVGFAIVYFRATSYRIKKEDVLDLPLLLVIPVLFGARAYHIFHYWDFYINNPGQIVAFWQGGLGIWGALIFGLATLIFWTKVKKIKLLSLLDLLAPSVVLTQSIGRLGNFFNLEAFGPPTTLPWRIYIPPSTRPPQYFQNEFFHPTFFYEAIADFLIFLILIFSARKFKNIPGLTFFLYVMLIGVVRFGLEFLRVNTWSFGEIKVAQVLAFSAILAGFGFLILKFRSFDVKRKDFLSSK